MLNVHLIYFFIIGGQRKRKGVGASMKPEPRTRAREWEHENVRAYELE